MYQLSKLEYLLTHEHYLELESLLNRLPISEFDRQDIADFLYQVLESQDEELADTQFDLDDAKGAVDDVRDELDEILEKFDSEPPPAIKALIQKVRDDI